MSVVDLVVISVLGGVLSSAIVLVLTVALAAWSVRAAWDLDNVLAPVVTAALMSRVADDVRGFAIDPPGQCGHVDGTSSECAHYEDQIPMYKALVNDDDVTEEELSTYFKSMQFGPGTTISAPAASESTWLLRSAVSRISASHGESRRIDAAMQRFLSTSRRASMPGRRAGAISFFVSSAPPAIPPQSAFASVITSGSTPNF